jgi:arylsulfatase A-like enzyme
VQVDLLPTFLDLAGAPMPQGHTVDGQSLVPLLLHGDVASGGYKDSIISQFHGENLVMSWYMIRKDLADGSKMKYVVWGTGVEHPPQLFNLSADPNEMNNLAVAAAPDARPTSSVSASTKQLIATLDAELRAQVDYPAVTKDVASYNIQMARWWWRPPHSGRL